MLEGLSTRLMPHTPPSSTTTALAALLVLNAPLLLLVSLVLAWALSLLALLVVPALFATAIVVVLLRCVLRSLRGPPNPPYCPRAARYHVRRGTPRAVSTGARCVARDSKSGQTRTTRRASTNYRRLLATSAPFARQTTAPG